VCPLKPGVVDEYIDPSELLGRHIDNLPAVGLIAHVPGDQYRPTSGLLDPLRAFACVHVLIEIGNQHVGTFTCKCDSHGTSYSRVSSGDYHRTAGKPAASSITLFAMIRSRVEHGGISRRHLLLFRERRAGTRGARIFRH